MQHCMYLNKSIHPAGRASTALQYDSFDMPVQLLTSLTCTCLAQLTSDLEMIFGRDQHVSAP